jgi:phosphomannomutase
MANRAYEIEQNENENGRHKVMMAFEESIGYMCGTQVLDKDGVSGAIRAAELIAYLDEIDMTLMDKLNDIYTRYVCRNKFAHGPV